MKKRTPGPEPVRYASAVPSGVSISMRSTAPRLAAELVVAVNGSGASTSLPLIRPSSLAWSRSSADSCEAAAVEDQGRLPPPSVTRWRASTTITWSPASTSWSIVQSNVATASSSSTAPSWVDRNGRPVKRWSVGPASCRQTVSWWSASTLTPRWAASRQHRPGVARGGDRERHQRRVEADGGERAGRDAGEPAAHLGGHRYHAAGEGAEGGAEGVGVQVGVGRGVQGGRGHETPSRSGGSRRARTGRAVASHSAYDSGRSWRLSTT